MQPQPHSFHIKPVLMFKDDITCLSLSLACRQSLFGSALGQSQPAYPNWSQAALFLSGQARVKSRVGHGLGGAQVLDCVCSRPAQVSICTVTGDTASLSELCLRTGSRHLVSTNKPQVRDSIVTDLTEQRGEA